MKLQKIKITIILLFLFLTVNLTNAEDKEYIFTDDIKTIIENNNLNQINLEINWLRLPIEARKNFEFYKISHSTTNPDIKYPDNYIWFTDDINLKSATDNFENYNPNLNGINYYRTCIVSDKYYCSKNVVKIDLSQNQTLNTKITLEELSQIKTFLRDNKNTITFIVNSPYLSEKIGIKTDDLAILPKQFLNIKDFFNIKILIELVAKDIQNSKEIENFVGEYKNKNFNSKEEIKEIGGQLDNWLDLNSRSKDELGNYDLTKENENKLNELKNILKEELSLKENKDISKNITLNSTTNDGIKTRSISYSGDTATSNAKVEVTVDDNSLKYIIILGILILISFIIYKFSKSIKLNNNKNEENSKETSFKENILQILKSENEYIVEYNGIYNKGIKVLEQNKNNITSSIYNYVNSINKLQVRGKDLYEELNNLDIKIPDLKESGNTLYRLYLPENIRISLKNEDLKNPLVIKTDEQEIPWEIMHDNDNFLSLKFPISRKIMTRENIRKNEVIKNKIPKILFITNPTLDLEGAIKETKEIINKLGKKADITLINGKEVTSTKIFSLLGQNFWDIIHYSGHAYFDKANPDQSGLVLNDGVITAGEIKRVLNGKPLIFLNGCSSGRSDEKDFEKTGEDTTGIASSFLIGGASGVISTLWPVTDKASSSFAIEFYDNFLKHETIGNSILKAKKEIFINFPQDITWASFIYYGEANLTIN